MARASISRRTSDGTNGAAAYELIAPATRSIRLLEMLISLAAATASTYGLGYPAAKGITPTTPASAISEGGSPSPMVTATALAWATGPTLPTGFFRRISFPATIASFIPWTWSNGLVIPAGSSIVLWNLAANGVVDVSVVVDE